MLNRRLVVDAGYLGIMPVIRANECRFLDKFFDQYAKLGIFRLAVVEKK
jgi:hypothetical protein